MEIPLPPLSEKSDYEKLQIAIEFAFSTLVTTAITQGLPIERPMGLMYLSTQDLTSRFQDASKAILLSLVKPGAKIKLPEN